MTDIEKRALELLNDAGASLGLLSKSVRLDRRQYTTHEALCRALEAHEADKQRFSDALTAHFGGQIWAIAQSPLAPFILAPVDPLVEAIRETFPVSLAEVDEGNARDLRAALEARGLAIVKKDAVNG